MGKLLNKLKDKALGFGALVGVLVVGSAISSNPILKSKAALFASFMRSNPVLGGVMHATLSIAITVSGIPFALVDLGAAWVYGFKASM